METTVESSGSLGLSVGSTVTLSPATKSASVMMRGKYNYEGNQCSPSRTMVSFFPAWIARCLSQHFFLSTSRYFSLLSRFTFCFRLDLKLFAIFWMTRRPHVVGCARMFTRSHDLLVLTTDHKESRECSSSRLFLNTELPFPVPSSEDSLSAAYSVRSLYSSSVTPVRTRKLSFPPLSSQLQCFV